MNYYLIDPSKKTIEDIELSGSLHSFYKAIGCTNIEAVEDLIVDGEGLINGNWSIFDIWEYDGIQIIGKAVVTSVRKGRSVSPTMSKQEVLSKIRW